MITVKNLINHNAVIIANDVKMVKRALVKKMENKIATNNAKFIALYKNVYSMFLLNMLVQSIPINIALCILLKRSPDLTPYSSPSLTLL